MKSYIKIVIVMGLVIPVTVWAGGQTSRKFAPTQPASATRTVQEQGGRLSNRNDQTIPAVKCRVELLKSRIITIGASQTGTLKFVEPGEVGLMVEKDKIVAQVKDNVIQERKNAAEKRAANTIEIEYAQATNAVSERKYKTAKDNPNSYPVAERMELALDVKKTLLQITKANRDKELAALELGEIEAEISTYEMQSPISGEVTEVMKKTGESVRQGDDIMRITDVSMIRAIGTVSAEHQPEIRKGMRVRVEILPVKGGRKIYSNVFNGTITFIDHKVSGTYQTFEVYATIKNQKDKNGNYILKERMGTTMKLIREDR